MAIPKGNLAQGLLASALATADAKVDDETLAKMREKEEADRKAALDAADKKPAKGVKFRTHLKTLRFPDSKGNEHYFLAGQLVTEDEALIRELRAACAVRGALIWEVK